MRLVFIVFVIAALSAGVSFAQLDSCDGLSQGVKPNIPAYYLGEVITFQFAIRNNSSSTTVVKFPTAKQFDIWVTQGDGDVFRASKGRMYVQTATSIALKPGETKTFTATWNQRDMNTGKEVGPGVYMVHAQLAASGKNPPPITSSKVQIGMPSAALVPITVGEAIANATALLGRKVMVAATYRGMAPDSNNANTKAGPPVDSNDWAICDATGCMYVTGTVTLDPTKDTGTTLTVVGRVARTDKGQVYLILLSATTSKGSVCPI
jgi:hypothetical protein